MRCRRLGRPRRRVRGRYLSAPGGGDTVPAAVAIRVLIVDDHAVVRTGLRLLLDREEDIEVVGRGGRRRRGRPRRAAREAGYRPARRRHAGPHRARGLRRGRRGVEGQGADALDAGRSVVRARGVRGGRERLHAQGGGRHGARPGGARGRGRRPLRPPDARRAACAGRGRGRAPGGERSALRPRARGAAAARPRPHEPGDREAALHLGAHGRDAPRAHHAEARPRDPGRARPLRARERAARRTEA